MKLRNLVGKTSFAAIVLTLAVPGITSAHITITPDAVAPDSFQTFNITIPNEKEVAFNEVKLTLPEGVGYVMPMTQPGWLVSLDKNQSDEVESIKWSGYEVPPDFIADFSFNLQVPAEETDMRWKIAQTYTNGEVVNWVSTDDTKSPHEGSPTEDEDMGPMPVTRVIEGAEGGSAASIATADTAGRAQAFGVIALLLSVVALALYVLFRTGIYPRRNTDIPHES